MNSVTELTALMSEIERKLAVLEDLLLGQGWEESARQFAISINQCHADIENLIAQNKQLLAESAAEIDDHK